MPEVMNFFRAQDEARGRTTKLVAWLIFAILAMALSIYAVAVLVLTYIHYFHGFTWVHPILFLTTFGLSLAVVLGGAYLRMAEFEGGGLLVALRLGARPVLTSTQDLNERKFLNIVQEMALASGMPVPQCLVLDQDPSINAFAAGHTPQDAVITVTRGALEQLTRDELQGVVGHEFSHIAHGDTQLNLRIIGTVAGLTALSQVGYVLMRIMVASDDEDNRAGWALIVMGLVVFIVGLGGVFIARLIQASVSRQREYLADASSVQFTRNPLGLANALKKVAGMTQVAREAKPAELEAQHMFLVSSGGFAEFLFSTHPPIEDRIKRIDPSFDAVIRPVIAATPPPPVSSQEATVQQLNAAILPAVAAVQTPTSRRVYPSDLDIQAAVGFHGQLPPELLAATTDLVSAMGLVLALVFRQDPGQKAEQLKLAQTIAGGEVVSEALRLEPLLKHLPNGTRLPLLDLALPTLRGLAPLQLQAFRDALSKVAYQEADGFRLLLLEALMHRYLGIEVTSPTTPSLSLEAAAGLVLSAVVMTSSESPEDRLAAYKRAVGVAGFRGMSLALAENPLANLALLEEALVVLAAQKVADRRNFVRACGVAVLYDNQAEPAEIEILRAVSDAIGISLATGLEH
jgi:Zn-dependent protease with chaperone function